MLLFAVGSAAYAATDGRAELNENILKLLEELDLSELQKYLDTHTDSYLLNFGNTAREIVEYFISGNGGTDYGSYLNELFSIIFKDVINLVPAFASVTAISLLSAVVSAAEGNIIGKSTSKIIHLACYSLIILVISTVLAGTVGGCIDCVRRHGVGGNIPAVRDIPFKRCGGDSFQFHFPRRHGRNSP